jgi:hypothetical protein
MLSSKVQQVKTGDIIRSLDFPGMPQHYMIGVVTKIENGLIHCNGISRVLDSKAEKFTGDFQTPVQGNHFMDAQFPGRITVL